MRRRLVRLGEVVPLLMVGLVGCGSEELSDGIHDQGGKVTLTAEEAATIPKFGDDPKGESLEVVFQSVRVLNAKGAEISEQRQGTLTLADYQRVARPWTHQNEPYTYHEQTWQR